jgi:hypothetical protein
MVPGHRHQPLSIHPYILWPVHSKAYPIHTFDDLVLDTPATEDTGGGERTGRSLGPPQVVEATDGRGEPSQRFPASVRPDRPTATRAPEGEEASG